MVAINFWCWSCRCPRFETPAPYLFPYLRRQSTGYQSSVKQTYCYLSAQCWTFFYATKLWSYLLTNWKKLTGNLVNNVMKPFPCLNLHGRTIEVLSFQKFILFYWWTKNMVSWYDTSRWTGFSLKQEIKPDKVKSMGNISSISRHQGWHHTFRRPALKKQTFKGQLNDLKVHIYDCADTRQVEIYTKMTDDIRSCAGSKYSSGA